MFGWKENILPKEHIVHWYNFFMLLYPLHKYTCNIQEHIGYRGIVQGTHLQSMYLGYPSVHGLKWAEIESQTTAFIQIPALTKNPKTLTYNMIPKSYRLCASKWAWVQAGRRKAGGVAPFPPQPSTRRATYPSILQSWKKFTDKKTRLTYNWAHLRSTKKSLTFEYLDIFFLWHVSIGRYWTGRYMMVLVQYRSVLC